MDANLFGALEEASIDAALFFWREPDDMSLLFVSKGSGMWCRTDI